MVDRDAMLARVMDESDSEETRDESEQNSPQPQPQRARPRKRRRPQQQQQQQAEIEAEESPLLDTRPPNMNLDIISVHEDEQRDFLVLFFRFFS